MPSAIYDHHRLDDSIVEFSRASEVFRDLGTDCEWSVADVQFQRGELVPLERRRVRQSHDQGGMNVIWNPMNRNFTNTAWNFSRSRLKQRATIERQIPQHVGPTDSVSTVHKLLRLRTNG